MKSFIAFLFIISFSLNANAQLGDLFRKLGDAVDSISKQNTNNTTNPNESENKTLNSADEKPTSDSKSNESSQPSKSNTETNSNNQLNKNASITSQEIDIRGFKIGMSINEVLNNIKKTVPKNEGLEDCRILNLGAIDSPELYLSGDQYIFCNQFKFFNKSSTKFELFFIDSKLVLLKMPLNNFDIEGDWTKNLMVPDYYIALNEKFAVSPPFLQSGGKKDRFNSNWEYRSLFSDKNGSTVRIDGSCRGVNYGVQCRDNLIRLFSVNYGKILETRKVKLNDLTKLYNDKLKENDKSKL
jgi:hypothetical protein